MPRRSQRRNDLCSCGSGKKYKRCCLAKERVARQAEAATRKRAKKDDKDRSIRSAVVASMLGAYTGLSENFEE